MCAVCVCVNFQIHCLKRNLSGFVAFFNRSLYEDACSRIRLVAFDCCFALGRLDGLLIHSFINFIIIIIWWLAEGITMVLLLRNGIRLMVFFPTSKRDWFFLWIWNVCVWLVRVWSHFRRTIFSIFQLEQMVFYVLWLISCGWIFMINSSQANDAGGNFVETSLPLANHRSRFEMMLQAEHVD